MPDSSVALSTTIYDEVLTAVYVPSILIRQILVWGTAAVAGGIESKYRSGQYDFRHTFQVIPALMRLLAGQIELKRAPIPARFKCRIFGLKNPLHRIQKKLYQISSNYVDEVRSDVARLPSLGAKLDYLMRKILMPA